MELDIEMVVCRGAAEVWESNPGPPEEQRVLLAPEPSLQVICFLRQDLR